jgi:hypothetical protein
MELPKDVQEGKIVGYNQEKGFGFINWPDHRDIHFSRKNSLDLLKGKSRADLINRDVRFYARPGMDEDHPTAEIVEILGLANPVPQQRNTGQALKLTISGERSFLTLAAEYNIEGIPQAGREISIFAGHGSSIKERLQPRNAKDEVVPFLTEADGVALGYVNLTDFPSKDFPNLIAKVDRYQTLVYVPDVNADTGVTPAKKNEAPKERAATSVEVFVDRQRLDGSHPVSLLTKDSEGPCKGIVVISTGQKWKMDAKEYDADHIQKINTSEHGKALIFMTLMESNSRVPFSIEGSGYSISKLLLKGKEN